MTEQLTAFYHSALTGCMLCFFYDIIRIMRCLINPPIFWINIEDIIFSFIASLICFGITLTVYPGTFRLYMLTGLIMGGLIYHFCVGKYIVSFIGKKFAKIRKFINKKIILYKNKNK